MRHLGAAGSLEPGLEGFEFETCRDDPAFLIGVPDSAEGFGLVLIGEGDIEGGLGGSASRSSSFLRRRGESVEHCTIIGPDEPIEEAFVVVRQRLGREPGVFQLFQDEGPDEDFAAGIDAALGFSGSSELVEPGL